MNKQRKLIYIGDHFYMASKSIMSSIYTEDGQRWDWGFLQNDLKNGMDVSIRQANPVEREHFEGRLAQLMKQQTRK